MTEATSGLENKANAGDPNALIGELMGAFEEFKRSNDTRLAELEKRGSADVLTEDKVNRLNAASTTPRRRSTAPISSGRGRGSRAGGPTPATNTRRRSPPM